MYERFERPGDTGTQLTWDWRKRCDWLGRQLAHDAGPYEQLAKVFRQHGYTADAEAILIAQRHAARRANRGRRPLRRALDAGYAWTVGYGFRPSRVLWLLVVLLVAVGVSLHLPAAQATMRATDPVGTVHTVDAAACGDGRVRCSAPRGTPWTPSYR